MDGVQVAGCVFSGLGDGAPMFYAISIARSLLIGIGLITMVAGIQLAWPREAMPSRSQVGRFVVFLVVFTVAAALINYVAHSLFGPMRFAPLLSLPGLGGAAVALIVGDFCYYWMHRAQHAIPFLWRFHAVHHSIEKMGPGASYHHVSETLLWLIFYTPAVSLFLRPEYAALVSLIVTAHGSYIHSTTLLHFGPLGRIFADNRTHRVHHSRELHHHDKNFAAQFMLWDQLFGTAHFEPDAWPEIGMAERAESKTVAEYLLARSHLANQPVFESPCKPRNA